MSVRTDRSRSRAASLPCMTGPVALVFVAVGLLAAAFPARALAELAAGDLAIAAPPMAWRQEPSLPVAEPSSVTLTVQNTSPASDLRVDTAALEFRIGSQSVASQYLVTAPGLPVTVGASSSQALVFRVTPKARAIVSRASGRHSGTTSRAMFVFKTSSRS